MIVREVRVPEGGPFVLNVEKLRELGITQREHEILGLIAEGLSNREIGERARLGDKYAAWTLEKMRTDGATPAAIAEARANMEKFKELYRNPFFNVAVTFLEVFPVGLIVTLVSAGILRRKTPAMPATVTA